jgi:D-alanine-D-alanine ligase
MSARKRVALLFGGRSGEHGVSVRSAESVAEGLERDHDVACILIEKTGRWRLQDGSRPRAMGGEAIFLAPDPTDEGTLRRFDDAISLVRPDVFFPVLHGPYGEDGTIQGLFDLAGVPYVGAGVAASAAAMDKTLMKSLFAQAGLPQVRHRTLRSREASLEARALDELGLPVFVKPANLGSSVAVSKVSTAEALGAALDLALAYDHKVVIEEAVDAREIEVAVLGNEGAEPSVPGEIVPDREFYDYDSKYAADSTTKLIIPAPLDEPAAAEIRRLAVDAFAAVDACGLARVDFFVERSSGRVLVNEVNTMPGFTSISMYPRLWAASGVPYRELLARLVALALSRHSRRATLRTDFGR